MSARAIAKTTAGVASIALVCLAACSFGLPDSVAEWRASHPPDAGIGPDVAAPGCGPTPLTGPIQSTWKPPHAHVVACDEERARGILNCLLFPGLQGTPDCQQRFTNDPTCLDCIRSTSTDPQLGPIVLTPRGDVYANLSGCVALLANDVSPNGCAAKMGLVDDCIEAVCGTCSDDTTYKQCANVAIAGTGPCAGYKNQTSCADQYAAACRLNVENADQAPTVTRVFCL